MKVGDKVYCHKSCIVGISDISLLKDKTYTRK